MWIYETKKLYEFDARMTPEEKKVFYIDPKTYDWATCTYLYGYGFDYYMHKQDVYEPDGKTLLVLTKNKFRYFEDFRQSFIDNQLKTPADPVQIKKDALASVFV